MSDPKKMFLYAQRVRALANAIYNQERGEGSPHLDSMAMASAACMEVATRFTLEACEMGRDEFLYAVGQHYDLARADMEKQRKDAAN